MKTALALLLAAYVGLTGCSTPGHKPPARHLVLPRGFIAHQSRNPKSISIDKLVSDKRYNKDIVQEFEIGDTIYHVSIPWLQYVNYMQKNNLRGFSDINAALSYITYTDPVIKKIAGFFTEGCETLEEKAERIMKIVQCDVEYYPDTCVTHGKGEYFRYPLETLAVRLGDCDCKAILAAALLRSLEINVAFLFFQYKDKETGEDEAHLAVGIEGNFLGVYYDRFFYAETTSEREIGVIWPRLEGLNATVYPIE